MARRIARASGLGDTPRVSCQVKVTSSSRVWMESGNRFCRTTASAAARADGGARLAPVVDLAGCVAGVPNFLRGVSRSLYWLQRRACRSAWTGRGRSAGCRTSLAASVDPLTVSVRGLAALGGRALLGTVHWQGVELRFALSGQGALGRRLRSLVAPPRGRL